MADSGYRAPWTLLTGHGHVLVAVAKNPQARIRDISEEAGLTERATVSILKDLEAAGYITRHRSGRRTTYTIHVDRGFRHESQGGLLVGPFLELLVQGSRTHASTAPHQVERTQEARGNDGGPAERDRPLGRSAHA